MSRAQGWPAVHPIVAPALIGIWALLLLGALGRAEGQARQQQVAWLELASHQAEHAGTYSGEWTVVYRPPACSCDAPRTATVLAELRALDLREIPVVGPYASHDLVIVAPDGRVAYAGGVELPSGALCSTSMRTPVDLLKSGWLSADIPVLDRPTPCRCEVRA